MIGQNYINPNTLNDFSVGNVGSMGFSAINGNKVLLFVYAPHAMPGQVLRSFMYQFTPNFVDALAHSSAMSLDRAVSTQAKDIPNCLTAIMPDAEGKVADVSNWNNYWTFTLVLDIQQATFNNIIVPNHRKIATGYFTDEAGAYDPTGNFLLNPNAVMVFTHATNVDVRSRIGSRAATTPDGLDVYAHTSDYAGEAIPHMFSEDMFVGCPRDLAKVASANNTDTFTSYDDLSLTHVRDGAGTRSIDNDLKLPRQQLGQIMHAVDIGLMKGQYAVPVHDTIGMGDRTLNPVDRALDAITNNLPTSQVLDIVTGLDTSRPWTISEVNALYPNLEVYPFAFKNPNMFGWDIAQQVGINGSGQVGSVVCPKMQMSSLASSVIQAVCSSIGIATCAFSYRWLDGDGFVAGKNDAFNLSMFCLMVPRPPNITKQLADQMKCYLDDHLFEIIHTVCGEFEINALCDMAGKVLIDLRLFNYPDAQDGAYFHTDAKLGGIVNPMIGGLSIINNNAMQLAETTKSLVGYNFAQQDFPQPGAGFPQQTFGQQFPM